MQHIFMLFVHGKLIFHLMGLLFNELLRFFLSISTLIYDAEICHLIY
jgi:hypothetical protein